ncbi:DNA-binding transcriptional regulator, LysR family [Tistlia consotensis]|uniref:DNA-binding transcriptional regulator, LysR family n=1 Tax=Tistlia consotensis USBA 355 TaxID=560819 RepID=A0A1Y6CHU1_9PROT|nr:LysR family transcriptional regulator [Tistlia consotensis]SMF55720.1 DNA-binding transcriptional regulator, LysR family [Tistlia consotensis USBA 355]SNR89070.1 DNA-binding transcriptional regulator, LysR family [Tistlia consotensis]
MTLNLAQVRAFVAVVDSGGFQEAARRLGCAQPTVTQLVRKLETGLAAQLVVRGRRGALPTPDGARFLPHARLLLSAEQRAVASVAGRSLAIGASGNVGTYLLPPLVRRFGELSGQGPELVIATNPEIAERVEAGEVDLAVMEWWDGRPGFTAEVWRRERLVVIVAPDHPWAHDGSIPRAWLLEVAMLGGEAGSGTGRLLQGLFGDEAARVRVTMNLGSTAAVKEAVKAGLGISLVFLSSVRDEVLAGSLCALDLDGAPIEKELFVVMPENVPPTAPSARFRSLLLEQRP